MLTFLCGLSTSEISTRTASKTVLKRSRSIEKKGNTKHLCIRPQFKVPVLWHQKQYWHGPEILRSRKTVNIYIQACFLMAAHPSSEFFFCVCVFLFILWHRMVFTGPLTLSCWQSSLAAVWQVGNSCHQRKPSLCWRLSPVAVRRLMK